MGNGTNGLANGVLFSGTFSNTVDWIATWNPAGDGGRGTILHEHWRIEFRRQYFTSRRAMQRSLDAFMKFYNERRPHQGYVLRGRTPAELFVGVAS